jgi:hypothetical protein
MGFNSHLKEISVVHSDRTNRSYLYDVVCEVGLSSCIDICRPTAHSQNTETHYFTILEEKCSLLIDCVRPKTAWPSTMKKKKKTQPHPAIPLGQ